MHCTVHLFSYQILSEMCCLHRLFHTVKQCCKNKFVFLFTVRHHFLADVTYRLINDVMFYEGCLLHVVIKLYIHHSIYMYVYSETYVELIDFARNFECLFFFQLRSSLYIISFPGTLVATQLFSTWNLRRNLIGPFIIFYTRQQTTIVRIVLETERYF